MKLYSGDEGTNHYICRKCKKACDWKYEYYSEIWHDKCGSVTDSIRGLIKGLGGK